MQIMERNIWNPCDTPYIRSKISPVVLALSAQCRVSRQEVIWVILVIFLFHLPPFAFHLYSQSHSIFTSKSSLFLYFHLIPISLSGGKRWDHRTRYTWPTVQICIEPVRRIDGFHIFELFWLVFLSYLCFMSHVLEERTAFPSWSYYAPPQLHVCAAHCLNHLPPILCLISHFRHLFAPKEILIADLFSTYSPIPPTSTSTYRLLRQPRAPSVFAPPTTKPSTPVHQFLLKGYNQAGRK